MIEPLGILMYGYDGEDDVSVILGEDHDDVAFRFITLVGGTTGQTLRFESADGMTVADFFEALEDEGQVFGRDAAARIADLEEQHRAAVFLVAAALN